MYQRRPRLESRHENMGNPSVQRMENYKEGESVKTRRMTEEEYQQAKDKIEELKEQIAELRRQKKKLANRVYHYEYSKDKLSTKPSLAYILFGKRQIDLNDEERKEYQRVRKRISRNKTKEASL